MQPAGAGGDGVPRGAIDFHPQLCRQADCPHHPQRILGEPVGRAADRAQPPPGDVADAVERVDDAPAGDVLGDGVDCEVTPLQVLAQAGAELDLRAARTRIRIPLRTERGHVDLAVAEAGADGAEGGTDFDYAAAARLAQQPGDLIRQRRRRQVEVGCQAAQDAVAHRTADQVYGMPGPLENDCDVAQKIQCLYRR